MQVRCGEPYPDSVGTAAVPPSSGAAALLRDTDPGVPTDLLFPRNPYGVLLPLVRWGCLLIRGLTVTLGIS
jgi:hypothetical protein